MGDKSRDITMHASKLKPAFVLSTAQEFVFKTHCCGFYGEKIIGGKTKVIPNRVALKLKGGINSHIMKFPDGNKTAGVQMKGWYSLQNVKSSAHNYAESKHKTDLFYKGIRK